MLRDMLKKLFVAMLGVLLLASAVYAPAQAVERDQYIPTVVNAKGDSITLRFSNPNNYWVCWEYRTDGDTSEVIGSNFNSAYSDLYPYVCLANDSTEVTIPVDQYVEVRSVFGAERDHDFDWVKFELQPYHNLAVCYEGEIGDQAVEARFGYFAENLQDPEVFVNKVTGATMLPQDIPVGENSERVWSSNPYTLHDGNIVWTVKLGDRQKTATIDKLGGKNSVVTESNQCPQGPEPVGLTKQAAYVMAFVPGSAKPFESGYDGYSGVTDCYVITYQLDGKLIPPSEERTTMVCSKSGEQTTGPGYSFIGMVDHADVAIVYRWVDADGDIVRYTWRGQLYPFKYGRAEDMKYTMNGRKLWLYPRQELAADIIRQQNPDLFSDN